MGAPREPGPRERRTEAPTMQEQEQEPPAPLAHEATAATEPPTEQAAEPSAEPSPAPSGDPDAGPSATGGAASEAARPAELSPAACGRLLAERFPALFAGPGPVRPIKLRIQADIQARAPGVFSRRVLSVFLSRHTTGNAYLKALVQAPHRFDLDGQPAGEIAPEHREAAREELERRRAVHRAKAGPAGPAGATPQRPPAQARPQAEDRPAPAAGGSAAAGGAPPRPRERNERPQRPQRPERPGHPQRTGRPPERVARGAREGRDGRTPGSPVQAAARPAPAQVEDPARRQRAQLLRAWETSPLAKANFCALMRIGEAELDAALEQARQERRGG